jgi:hypothetical protein
MIRESLNKKFVLEVPVRTKDIFLNRKVSLAASASLWGWKFAELKALLNGSVVDIEVALCTLD